MSINNLLVPLVITVCFPSIMLIGIVFLDYCITKIKLLLN